MRLIRHRSTRALSIAGLALSLCACGGGDSKVDAGATADAVAAEAPALHGFDVYATASEDGNILQADLYGITLQPLRAYRLTSGKRISYVSADADSVVVSAAYDTIDRLAEVGEGGTLNDVPGLGRPHAFTPEILSDGKIYFEMDGDKRQYLSWDPSTRTRKVLFASDKEDVGGVSAGPDRQFLYLDQRKEKSGEIVVVGPKGAKRSYPVAPSIGAATWGERLIAVTLLGAGSGFPPAIGTVLLDPGNGKKTTVQGWAPLAWSPDRKELLVTRGSEPAVPDAELAVMDPAQPGSPRVLGELAKLTIFQASWVDRGSATATPSPAAS